MFEILRQTTLTQTGSCLVYMCILMIFFILKNREQRYQFVYPVYMLFLSFVVSGLYETIWVRVLDNVSDRAINAVPIAVIVALVLSYFWQKMKGLDVLIAAVGIGFLLYFCSDQYFDVFYEEIYPAENLYGIPQDVVDVCDLALSETEEPLLLVSQTDVDYFRQYSAKVKLLYGEDVYNGKMGGAKTIPSEYWQIYSYMSNWGYVDLVAVEELIYPFGVDYIVINCDEFTSVAYEGIQYYSIYTRIGRYVVWRNNSLGE